MFRRIASAVLKDCNRVFTPQTILCIVIGMAIASFGLHNIHQRTGITEGGVLGMILLLHHWFGIPAAIASPVLDLICYFAAFRLLGKRLSKNVGSGQCLSGRMVLPLGTAAVFPSGSVRASAGSSSGRRGIYRSGSRSGRSPRRIIRRG